jgi:hypothetical protein
MDVMVEPARVPGRHNVFVAGGDASAKQTVKRLLGEFGWPGEVIVDLGGIQAARATEMYMQLYFTLAGVSRIPFQHRDRPRVVDGGGRVYGCMAQGGDGEDRGSG